ncbi:hypothetical protein ES705_42081 [subsurface metagenome]
MNEKYEKFLYPLCDCGEVYDKPINLKGTIELDKDSCYKVRMKLLWHHPVIHFGHDYFYLHYIPEREESKQIQQFQILKEIEKNFRKCINRDSYRERDVQDFLESFFHAKEYDFKREKETVQFSEKRFQPDFTFNKLRLAIEVKFVDTKKKLKKVIDEMSADLVPYSKKWKFIFYIVYDKGGNINDISAFASDFNQDGEIITRCIVIKH